LREIVRKLKEEMEKISINEQYLDDPDDPPIPSDLKTFQFVEYDRYMTIDGLITFNFDNVIKESNIYWKSEYIENPYLDRCIMNGHNIPQQKCNWFILPMNLKIEEMKYRFFENFLHFGEHDIVSLEEMDELIKDFLQNCKSRHEYGEFEWNDELIKKIVKKYNLTKNAFLLDMMEVIGGRDKDEIFRLMRIIEVSVYVPRETSDFYGKRCKKCEKKKRTMSKMEFERHEGMVREL
jgi:hypothetical protein